MEASKNIHFFSGTGDLAWARAIIVVNLNTEGPSPRDKAMPETPMEGEESVKQLHGTFAGQQKTVTRQASWLDDKAMPDVTIELRGFCQSCTPYVSSCQDVSREPAVNLTCQPQHYLVRSK